MEFNPNKRKTLGVLAALPLFIKDAVLAGESKKKSDGDLKLNDFEVLFKELNDKKENIFNIWKININFLDDVAELRTVISDGNEFTIQSIKSLHVQLEAIKQIEYHLSKYPKVDFSNICKEIIIGKNFSVRNSNRIPKAASADKKIWLQVEYPELIEQVAKIGKVTKPELPFLAHAFDHEMGHSLAETITESDWINAVYKNPGNPNPTYIPNPSIFTGQRLMGFGRDYAKYSWKEDIAVTTEILFGATPITEDMKTDKVLSRKIRFLKREFAKVLKVHSSEIDHTKGAFEDVTIQK